MRPERRRLRRNVAWRALALLAACNAALPADADPTAGELEAYTASYQVSYRGIGGGQVESSLKPGGAPGIWLYSTRAYPNFLGRMAVSASAREQGTMLITGERVRPLAFEFNDGSAEDAKDVRLEFDWDAGKVTGTADGEQFTYDIEPGTQDTASVQAAMMVELLAGRAPTGFAIVAGGRLRQYRYWSEGTARITTPSGQYDTVVWASQRDGSSRMQRVWHAPELGYVPVQAIQYRKGKPELQMKLASLSRP
jgi:hypothetical protein